MYALFISYVSKLIFSKAPQSPWSNEMSPSLPGKIKILRIPESNSAHQLLIFGLQTLNCDIFTEGTF